MVDRVALLKVLPRASLPPVTAHEFHKLLDKAIGLGIAELGLKDARTLASEERQELEGALKHILPMADLRKVAKKWEPQRKIEEGTSENRIADALIELLQGHREPYEFADIPLVGARDLHAGDRETLSLGIRELAPLADLKKLAKKWDKENKELTAAGDRKVLAAALVALLEGTAEPRPRPRKVKKK